MRLEILKKKNVGEKGFSGEISGQVCVEKDSVTRRGWGKKPAKAFAHPPPIPKSLDQFAGMFTADTNIAETPLPSSQQAVHPAVEGVSAATYNR